MSAGPTTSRSGGCECGAVRYEMKGSVRKVVYCHCSQCRRTSGHFVAATACAREDLSLSEDSGLNWYRSSSFAERGFCRHCGSSLFYRTDDGNCISVMAGTVDTPTGLVCREHIHLDDASDYYAIDDGLPQFPGGHEDLWEDNDA